jgi:trans-2,3-dihydro-3-hydroxyanthranilate isomerase
VSARALPYQLCDVFTDRALTGNPLAVFTDGRALDGATMQALAREMNLSETTFVLPGDAESEARIRIFTPAVELPFAGHPTLGTAFVLAATFPGELLRLRTNAGVVPVRLTRTPDGTPSFGWMQQPIPTLQPFAQRGELLTALNIAPRLDALPLDVYDNGNRYVFVGLDSPDQVAALRPDLPRLGALMGKQLCSVFARDGQRWRCRMFAPGAGVPEDPATGSAAGPLAFHLARHGQIAFGDEIVIDQGIEMGRPSRLHARVLGSAGRLEAMEVGGAAVVIGGGEIRLPSGS